MVLGPNTIGAILQHDMCGVLAHGLKMGRKEHQGYYNDDNKRLITNQYMGKTHQSVILISVLLCYVLFQLHCG
jgi:hypothetical protein